MKHPLHSIAFRPAPERPQKLRPKIVRARPNAPVDVILLQSQIWGVMVHWVNGRTKPCFGPVCPCKKLKEAPDVKWKGYALAATYDKDRKLVIVEIPVEAAWSCPRLAGNAEHLYGARLILKRANASPASTVVPHLTEGVGRDWPRPAIDLVEALSRVWWGVKPHERKAAAEWFGQAAEEGAIPPAETEAHTEEGEA